MHVQTAEDVGRAAACGLVEQQGMEWKRDVFAKRAFHELTDPESILIARRLFDFVQPAQISVARMSQIKQ